MKKIILFATLALICSPHFVSAETVSLSTYYPAPFGTYDRVRLVPRPEITGLCRVGTLYTRDTDFTLRYCADVILDPDAGAWGAMVGLWENDGSDNVYLIDTETVDFRVGIGTTSPISNLEVSRTRDAADITMLTLTTVGVGGIGDHLNLLFRQPATGGVLRNVAQISAIHNDPINNRGNLAFYTSITGALTEKMRINADGNVGIGTTSPASTLNVNGVVSIGNNPSSIVGTGHAIELTTDNTFGSFHDEHTGIRLFAYDMNGWTTAKLGIQVSDNWDSYIGDDAPAKSDMAMIIGQATTIIKGDVGIGTTNPVEKLDVNGSIRLRDDGTNWGKLMVEYNAGPPAGYYAVYAP